MTALKVQLALLGALPALLAMAYFDRLDAKRPEPRRTLRLVALAGALSSIPIVLIGQLLKALPPEWLATHPVYLAFVVAAAPEEAAKLAAMLIFAWRRPEFDERMDGVVYGARAGLGFALLENIAYLFLLPQSLSEYVGIFIGRTALAVPGHATWGGILGYFAAKRRFDGAGPGLLGGYLLAVALHGTYDALLFTAPSVQGPYAALYLLPALIIVAGAWALREFARRAIAADDAAEKAAKLWR